MDTLKKITIKTNTIKRYLKDINYYKKELGELTIKHETLLSDPNACPHVLSKQIEGIKETENMIPDCQSRLEAARSDLQEFLENHNDSIEITSSGIFKDAQSVLVQ